MSFEEIVCEFVFITLDVLVTWMSDNNAYLFRHKFIHVRGSAVVKGELETIESRSKVYLNVDRRRERFFLWEFCIALWLLSEKSHSFFLPNESLRLLECWFFHFNVSPQKPLFHALLLKLISLIILLQSMRYQMLNCLTLNINLKLNLCEREKVFISGSIYRCFSNENLHMTQAVLKCIY